MEWTDDASERVWEGYLSSNPTRILDVFRINHPHSPRNRWGDSFLEIFPAFVVLMRAVLEPTFLPTWDGLVREGIVEILCNHALEAPQWPTDPEQRRTIPADVLALLPPGYYYPLEILGRSVTHFKEPLSNSQQLFIYTVQKYWTRLMQRIWDVPGNSTKDEEYFARERIIVAQLVWPIVTQHPAFLTIVDDPIDLTIPVLVRASLHGTLDTEPDQSEFHIITGEVLYSFLVASTDASSSLSPSSRAALPSPQSVLRKIIKGASGSIDTLLAKLAWYLTWLNIEETHICVNLVDTVVQLAKNGKATYKRVLRNEELWGELLRVLKKTGENGGMDIVKNDARIGDQVAFVIFGMMLDGLRYGKHEAQDEYEPLAALLVKNELMETLDVFLSSLVARRDAAVVMSNFAVPIKFLFDFLHHALSIHPTLTGVLRPCLPRPRIVRCLLEAAFFPGGPRSLIDSKPTPRGLEPPQISIHTNYENFARLEREVRRGTEEEDTNCGRRGCKESADARCSGCQSIKYCGKQCQTSDWNEHKLVCGYVFERYDHDGMLMERISLPKTMAKKAGLEEVNRHINRLAFVPQNA